MGPRALLFLAFGTLLAVARAEMMGGGVGATDVQGEAVQKAAALVVSALNRPGCDGLCADLVTEGEVTLVRLLGATAQVVAGINFGLDMLVQDAEGTEIRVQAHVWSRPWLEGSNDADGPANKITSLRALPLGRAEART
ncbi:hypothetical protein HYH03_016127 [Edaphochlamys debaryana]|uniref:Uncharacterized protein n=1 Tax=Edaphochlamys debaryana TaxID=47281 RepID=A0A836BQ82_9CHLO|nr:hypothetical protein HYH03_016127 [Edaphochlamys debaryana]|eukprot:KAG2485141.1 hypothetical protein HYH03_016127 [Edaphochlamys debaryana]